MSNLVYDGSNGLFTRLGALVYMMDAVRTHQNNLKTLLSNVQGEYSSADSYMISVLQGNIDMRIEEAGRVLEDVRVAAETTLVEMCYASATHSNSVLPMRSRSLTDALTWLIRAMDSESTPEKVDGTTLNKGGTTYAGTNNGNGSLLFNVDCPDVLMSSTDQWPNVRGEVVEIRCVLDSQDGVLERGSETFEIRGQPSVGPLDYRFPSGSGAIVTIECVSASVDAGAAGQNLLTNSDMEQYAQNTPSNFTVSTGSHGTDFKITTTAANVYRGLAALELPASGNLMKLRQQMDLSTGTPGTLKPDTRYAMTVAVRKDANATGVFRMSLQDASGTILNSGAVKIEVNPATNLASTSWVQQTLTFKTPVKLPTSIYLVLETTTAIGTASIYVDEATLSEMVAIAPGGGAFAIVAGSSDWTIEDRVYFSITNTNEGAFVRAFDRLFDMYGKGLALPQDTNGNETILDDLIA